MEPLAPYRCAEEVADGKVGIQRQVRPDKRKASRDHGLERRAVRVGDTQVLGHALGLVIGACQLHRVGGSGVGLRGVEQCGAATVDGPGTGKEQAFCAGLLGKLQHPARAVQDALGKLICGPLRLRGRRIAGIGSSMDDMRVRLGGEGEAADIALVERDLRTIGDVRGLPPEARHAAGQHRGLQPEVQLVVGVEQRLQQPVAEEAGAAGDEEPRAAESFEAGAGERQHIGKILLG